MNKFNSFIKKQIELFFNQTKTNKQKECVTFIFDPLVKLLNSKRGILHYQLHCSCFITLPSVHTSLFMFHPISFSPHFIDHVSFVFLSVHSPSHSFDLPHSILLIFTLFGCIHITWSFNLIVSFTFQPIPSLEINDLQVSLDKFLILNRYTLPEAELWWFYYSLFLYLKQETQQRYKLSLQKRLVFYSDTVTRSPVFQPAIVFADFVYSQPGTMRISKFTFACTCLSFYSLPITPFAAFCLQ